jgi:hypothetical protein
LSDAVLFVLILAGLLLAMTALASSLAATLGPRRAMEPESWAESQCTAQLGPGNEETPEFDACRRDALTMPFWRLNTGMFFSAAACFAATILAAAVRAAHGDRTPSGTGAGWIFWDRGG